MNVPPEFSLPRALQQAGQHVAALFHGPTGAAPSIPASHLRNILNTIPDLVWIKDADGVYLACNTSFERFFGAPQAQIVGRTDHDFVPKEQADFFREKDREAMAADAPRVNEEWVTFASDGHRALLETIKAPMRDAEGRLVGVVGVARDITERKRIEEALHDSEQNYRELSECAPIGIFQRKLSGEYTYCNAYQVQQFECASREEFLALYNPAHLRWADPEALAEFNARLEREGVVRGFPTSVRLHNSKTKWFSLYATLDRPQMLVNGFALDITEQKQAEEALKTSEENYRNIINRAMEGFYQVSPQGRSLLANPTMVAMLGYDSSEQMGRELTDMGRQLWVRQEERERYARILDEHGEVRGFETELRRRDGRRIWVSLNARNVRDAHGQPQYFEGFLLDITERKLAEDALRASEENYRNIFNRSMEGFHRIAMDGTPLLVNARLLQIMGYDSFEQLVSELRETGRSVWVNPQERQRYHAALLRDGEVHGFEALHRRRDGQEIWVMLNSVLVRDEHGQPLYREGFTLDITTRKQSEDALERAANIDSLSGLHNRHALDRCLPEALAKAQAQGLECSLLFLDLDHFKRINDSLGHSAGDQLLVMAAQRLQALVGPNDFLARFGGDEFVILQPDQAPGTGATHALKLAHSIIADFAEAFHLGQNTASPFSLFVTPSIGIALSASDGLDAETLVKNADIAMYAAKAAGRNEARFFDRAMEDASRNAILIEDALHHAIRNREFRLVYQPIVPADGGQLHKVEALIRWESPTLGFVPPDRFIAVAEESGLIVEIGTWVLQEACRQASLWNASAVGPICISVNVSAWQLVDSDFLRVLADAIASNGIRGGQIELELTERVLIEEGDQVRKVLAAVHDLGVSISLDDFGTGYSSLNYLTSFHIDTLKIDRSFITRIETSQRDSTLVRAIVALGHSLGLQMVAEGVETQGQADILTQLGCQRLQGYLFSRPVPAQQITPDMLGPSQPWRAGEAGAAPRATA
ncbi:MAG: EAL domain-containing protein [Proteobacteria bacterium]|uniref:sensor domain-containing protein n=1 Tax=Aquabacterium sp. TaxID=1872578 RepID=UPI0035C7616D|nr:EAL domain-containing protein [Pseudomonadota bacterium]